MADWERIFKEKGRVFYKPQEDMHKIVYLLKKNKARKVLDLGCGTGRHTLLLAKKGFETFATDISSEGLKHTRNLLSENGLKAKLKKHSCYTKFPFEDEYFDAIISTQVIHHNTRFEVRKSISEIHRVLKPGGIIFITVAAKIGTRSKRVKEISPNTFLPLDGDEKGLIHYIYTKKTLKEDFSKFKISNIHRDYDYHLCVLGRKI